MAAQTIAMCGAKPVAQSPRSSRRQQLKVSAVAEVERVPQRVRWVTSWLEGSAAGAAVVAPACTRHSPPALLILLSLPAAFPAYCLQRGVPEGTPVVPVRDLPSRPRRNRKSETVRRAFSETVITPSNFILPVFVHDGTQNIPIDSMPGVARLGWQHGLIDAVAEARSFGVNQVGADCARAGKGREGRP